MKHILAVIFSLAAFTCVGQNWISYGMDDVVTVSIPDDFVEIDTLGQKIARAQIDNALILIQQMPNTGAVVGGISDKEDVLRLYENFQRGLIMSQQGEVKRKQVVERDGLQVLDLEYYAVMGEEKQLRHCLAIFVNENWYLVHFWEVESMSEALAPEREKFFSSVKIKQGLSLENQTTQSAADSRAFNIGYLFGRIGFFLIAPLMLVALIIWISRIVRKKKPSA